MNQSPLASSDQPTVLKVVCLKLAMVLVSAALDDFTTVQAVLVTLAVLSICYYHMMEVRSNPAFSAAYACRRQGVFVILLLPLCVELGAAGLH